HARNPTVRPRYRAPPSAQPRQPVHSWSESLEHAAFRWHTHRGSQRTDRAACIDSFLRRRTLDDRATALEARCTGESEIDRQLAVHKSGPHYGWKTDRLKASHAAARDS